MPLLKKLQPAARAIVWDPTGTKILLVKRQDLPVWELPGGGVEKDELPKEAVLREVFEETGLKVTIKKAIGIYYPLCRLASLSHTFECTSNSCELKISDESSDIAFFDIDKLPTYLPPPYPDWIRDTLEKKEDTVIKPISSVTYRALISYLIRYPKLVLTFIMTRIKRPSSS